MSYTLLLKKRGVQYRIATAMAMIICQNKVCLIVVVLNKTRMIEITIKAAQRSRPKSRPHQNNSSLGRAKQFRTYHWTVTISWNKHTSSTIATFKTMAQKQAISLIDKVKCLATTLLRHSTRVAKLTC